MATIKLTTNDPQGRLAAYPLLVPTLQAAVDYIDRYVVFRGTLDIEIKPSAGQERTTGEVVAREAARLWAGRELPPLLSSFKQEALDGARAAAPLLPRALLMEFPFDGWFECARALDCVAVVCDYTRLDAALVARLHAADLWAMAYTVNDEAAARWLLGIGLDGLVTDAVDRFSPSAGRLA